MIFEELNWELIKLCKIVLGTHKEPNSKISHFKLQTLKIGQTNFFFFKSALEGMSSFDLLEAKSEEKVTKKCFPLIE